MHLLCTQAVVPFNMSDLKKVKNFLLEADITTKSRAPMCWQFLDLPPDGYATIAWQPLGQMNLSLASDGYVWTDVEQSHRRVEDGVMVIPHWKFR